MWIPTGFPAANGRGGWANLDQTTSFEQELVAAIFPIREFDSLTPRLRSADIVGDPSRAVRP
jgi:hypothetical protein